MKSMFALTAAVAALAMAAPVSAQAPNDAQIAHIAYTAGSIDVEAGRQALQIYHNAAVRAFAETMVRDHDAVNKQALALVQRLNVKTDDNPTSTALADRTEEQTNELQSLMRISYAVFCFKTRPTTQIHTYRPTLSRHYAIPSTQSPNDAQIALSSDTAVSIDVEAGRKALQISLNAAFRAFAETMVRDHGAVNKQALALVQRLNVKPEANPTSTALADQAAATSGRLAKLTGAAFDRAYVDNEIAFHRTVNNALRDTLIPVAHHADLKSLIESGLALFTAHQTHAETQARDIK